MKPFFVTEILDMMVVSSQKGRYFEMKNRRWYGLSFCKSGQITYTHNGKSFVSEPCSAVILPKGQSYSLFGDKSGEFPLINFCCAEDFTDEFLVIPIQNSERLIRQFEKMRSLYLIEGNGFEVLSLFYGILHEFFGHSENGLLTPAVRYIEQNFMNPSLSNAELAGKCGISEVYFRKLFVKKFKVSPKQFVLDLRIHHAKQLLAEGALKNTAIAEKCGFASPYHFCRAFKQKTGMTPSNYMKQNKIYEI